MKNLSLKALAIKGLNNIVNSLETALGNKTIYCFNTLVILIFTLFMVFAQNHENLHSRNIQFC